MKFKLLFNINCYKAAHISGVIHSFIEGLSTACYVLGFFRGLVMSRLREKKIFEKFLVLGQHTHSFQMHRNAR